MPEEAPPSKTEQGKLMEEKIERMKEEALELEAKEAEKEAAKKADGVEKKDEIKTEESKPEIFEEPKKVESIPAGEAPKAQSNPGTSEQKGDTLGAEGVKATEGGKVNGEKPVEVEKKDAEVLLKKDEPPVSKINDPVELSDEPTPEGHEDLTDNERYNIDTKDLTTPPTNASNNATKSRWDLSGLQTEIIEIDGHKIILHHGSNFKMLDKYPVTDDPYNYILDEKTGTKLCTQAERAQYLHGKCKEFGLKRWDEMTPQELEKAHLPNLLVDDKHGVMFCQSLKKSSTNKWIKFIGIATGQVEEFSKVPIHHMEVLQMKGLNEYTPEERRMRLQNYTKLIVVRHPYRRLANLWDDDFRVEGTSTRWRLGPRLIEKFHGMGSYKHGDMLSYKDYITYILSGDTESYYGITLMDACSPCLVGYDYIRRIETGPLDSEDILKKLEIYDKENVRDAEKHHGLRSLTTRIHPMRELSEDLIQKLYQMYKLDIELFGYTQKGDRASCSIKRKDGTICC